MLVKMTCPQCGAAMDFDNSKDFMFCSYCGAKIANLAEKIELRGKVAIDESGKIDSFFHVADTALSSGNYGEAYNYYLRILETDPTNPKANLMKGLAGLAQSFPGNDRYAEGINSLNDNKNIDTVGAATMIKTYFTKAIAITDRQFTNYCSDGRKKTFATLGDVHLYFEILGSMIKYRVALCDFINDALMKSDKTVEDTKRDFISKSLDIAEHASHPVKYVVGYTTSVDKKGNVSQVENTSKMNELSKDFLKDAEESLKKSYNTLPSTVAALKVFDDEIAKNQAVVDDFEKDLKDFFILYPDLERTYRHPGLFGRSKKIDSVESQFSETLKNKKLLSESAKSHIKEVTNNKKSYTRKNTL